ncbi:MAG: Zn-ribbon domain-containing OB-fold protein [Nitrososphaerota archaeon]
MAKPLPEVSQLTKPFWDGAKNGELLLQKCKRCGGHQWYPRYSCHKCGSPDLEWSKASGLGRVYSFTVIRKVIGNSPDFANDIPFVVAEIDLDEGVRVYSNIIGVKPEDVQIGMRVRVAFEEASPEIHLFRFRPAT